MKHIRILLIFTTVLGALRGTEYLSFQEAIALGFPGAKAVERFIPKPTAQQQKEIMAAAKTSSAVRAKLGGVYFGARNQKLTSVAFIDHVVGRTEYMTYVCVLSPEGTVRNVALMTYREPIGDEVKRPIFTKQFLGKGPDDEIQLRRDISNISGATLSCPWGE